MFLPTTIEEAKKLGWSSLEIILITGDAYIDSSFIGVAVIGKVLVNAGFRVGIIAQPDVESDKDITRLGEPELFWGVTAGSVDSMVANYTASKKHRHQDDFTPGGENNQRPDRASIVYSNLIRKHFKNTKPIVLGGIEASLRRVAHYDYWSDTGHRSASGGDDAVRRSILFDAKADILVYGMGEPAVLELANRLKTQPVIPVPPKAGGIQRDKLRTETQNWQDIRGLCYISSEPKNEFIKLPSYEEVKRDKTRFIEMFHTFYNNNDPITAKGLCQKQDTRYLIQNPPPENLTTKELDAIYDLDYENEAHPKYKQSIKALETIRFSITSHRGCYGECNFCAIAVHQGRTVISRSPESIIREAEKMAKSPKFKGYISDVGGPTANMYGIECTKKLKSGSCEDKRCIYPEHCKTLKIDHSRQIELLRRIRQIPDVKKVFIGSGIRHDMVMEDDKYGLKYLAEVVEHHTSGQLKIAPEHTEDKVLGYMGKPSSDYLKRFKDEFYRLNKQFGKKQFLTYYLIAAHPGCSYEDMLELRKYTRQELKITPEQVQVFTPLPSTYSALMYYTGINPLAPLEMVNKDKAGKEKQVTSKSDTDESDNDRRSRQRDLSLMGFTGEPLFVEKSIPGKERQKEAVTK